MADSHRHGSAGPGHGEGPVDEARGERTDEALQAAYLAADRRARETTVLAYATRAVLDSPDFPDAARIVVSACRALLRSAAGYVVLAGEGGVDEEPLFVDPAHETARGSFAFPSALARLHEDVRRTGHADFENDLVAQEWAVPQPGGHGSPSNALAMPLVVDGRVAGVMGFVGLPDGFSEDELVLTMSFGEIAALALRNARTQEELGRRERFLARTEAVAHIGSWGRVLDGGEPMFSDEVYRIFGLDQDVHPFRTMSEFVQVVHPEDRERLAEAVAALARELVPQTLEFRAVRPDGSIRWVQSAADFETDEQGRPIAVNGYILDITDRKRAEEELTRHRRRLSELALGLLSGGEAERRRIAFDLHEGLGQALAAAKLSAKRLASGEGKVSAEEAERLVGLLSQAIDGMRAISSDLSPSVLYELGLGPALEWLAEGLLERCGLRCEISVEEGLSDLKSDAAILLFRVARELLDNVREHSGARSARVSVAAEGGGIVLCVEDEGHGFDPVALEAEAALRERHGLFGIREEVTSLGGALEVDSAPGRGTSVRIRVP